MPTEQDYHLQPQSGPLSKVICDRCDQEIGEVYTAETTPTGSRADAPSEAELTTNINDMVREHLHECHQGQTQADLENYQNKNARQQPESAGTRHRK